MLTPEPRTLSSDKSELRTRMKAIRARAFAQNKNAAFDLRDRFLEKIILPAGSVVSSYRSCGSEIDPAPLTEALRVLGHIIALPVMAGRGQPLIFRKHQAGEPLVPNARGIEEPGPAAPGVEPDVLLVPLLAFDRSRARLGTGGGYYDYTIAGLRRRKRVLTIGIGFSQQEIPQVPTAAHDVRLDRIATEIQIF